MTHKLNILKVLFFCLPIFLNAQDHVFQGYTETVGGTNFTYHSPFPDVKSSLLSRANKDFPAIEWKTEIVPVTYKKPYVNFIWVYGMDVLGDSKKFHLKINGKLWFSFSNPRTNDEEEYTIISHDKAKLTFRRTMVDKHKDQMGFAMLQVPTSAIVLGAQNLISVEGEAQGSNAWYMTYKTEIKEDVKIKQNNVVIKEKGKLYHVARFNFIHIGEEEKASIRLIGQKETFLLKPGLNTFDFKLDKVTAPTSFEAHIKIGKKPSQKKGFTLKPLKEWTIYLVQHSHTDIGYTRSQTEILSEHLRYIDFALDYCDQTDHYPDNAKFRWTCEASWAVREYLESRPKAQIDRLLNRIREGRIEVTGMFFNFSEIVDETALAVQTRTLKKFKERGIDVTTAMQNDVNGIGWCMIDYFDKTDVKYLTMGQHGHRARIPFDKPTSFWWESPSGNRLLAYRSEHYMHGNALSLTSGYLDMFQSNLSNYLEALESKNYPYDRTAFQFSGYVTDNSPPSIKACDIVREWNEKYEWPKLKIALAKEFMVYLENQEAHGLPVKKVAWPDWWTDGFGSAMNETKAARQTHANMITTTGLFVMAKMMGAQLPESVHDDIISCYDNLLFYDEHTFGAAESIRDPLSENSIIQWGEKASYVWTAKKEASLLREKALGLIQQFIGKSDVPSVVVFNTLSTWRSGLVRVFIDHDILPLEKEFSILDPDGDTIAAQLESSRPEGSYWLLWVDDVPAFGYKKLRVEVGDNVKPPQNNQINSESLENEYFRLDFDMKSGAVSSFFDKALNTELLDQNDSVRLGTFIYEQIASRVAMERLTNSNRDTVYVPLKKKLSTLSNVKVLGAQKGEIWSSMKFNGKIPVCADERGVNIEFRLYHKTKRIDITFDMHKLPVHDPEAVYVAFPFMMPDGQLSFDVQGGVVSSGINQLEGTASDWNTIQSFVSVKSPKGQIIFNSNEAPLVQLGDINTGRFYYKHTPQTSHVYSWVLNNYWTTNFKASQQGEMKWKYTISSVENNSTAYATAISLENKLPMAARVIAAGKNNNGNGSKSFLNIGLENLILVNAKPSADGKGIILQLRETDGNHAVLDVHKLLKKTHASAVKEVNVLEEEIKSLNAPFLIEHFETKFIKMEFEDNPK